MISKAIKIVLIAILGLTCTLHAKDDSISKFFDKYSNVDGVTYVNFTPSPELMAGAGEQMEDKDAAELMKNISSVKILTSKKRDKKGKQDKGNPQNLDNIFNDAKKSLPLDEFEKFLEVKDGNKEVKMLFKKSNEKSKAKEFLMIVKEDGDLTIIWVEGLIDLNDLGKLSKIIKK